MRKVIFLLILAIMIPSHGVSAASSEEDLAWIAEAIQKTPLMRHTFKNKQELYEWLPSLCSDAGKLVQLYSKEDKEDKDQGIVVCKGGVYSGPRFSDNKLRW